jgi:hypothetical protein
MKLFRLAALGAALVYFFDPQNGRRRRNMTRDRALAFFRQGKQKATHLREDQKDLDDVALAPTKQT